VSIYLQNLQYLSSFYNYNDQQLAEKIARDTDWVHNILNGNVEPDLSTLIKLSEILKISVDRLLKEDIRRAYDCFKNKQIKFLIVDIDGVMTDGGIYFSESGDELRKFNARDGLALMELQNQGIKAGLLSSGLRQNNVLNRAKSLKIEHVYVGRESKRDIMLRWCNELEITPENVAYIGDDLNDIDIIESIGLSACPCDAIREVKERVDVILSARGGNGCVREFIDSYLLIR
jgi:3-deoxy-D-manno-octulosonate 8-phosphate phosphatase (KDO 8-P phosphatase)